MSEVVADMAGTVVEVHVTAGQAVVAGEALVTIESMKMEFVIASPSSGVVEAVMVAATDAVGDGTVMAVIARPPSS